MNTPKLVEIDLLRAPGLERNAYHRYEAGVELVHHRGHVDLVDAGAETLDVIGLGRV
jgi:hypothetical protein